MRNKVNTCLLGPYCTQGVLPELINLLTSAGWKVICIDTIDKHSPLVRHIKYYFQYQFNEFDVLLNELFNSYPINRVIIDPLLFNQLLIPIQSHTQSTLNNYINSHLLPVVTISHTAVKYLTKLQSSSIIYILPVATIIHATLIAQTHVNLVSGAIRNLAIALFEDTRESNIKPSILYCNALRTAVPNNTVQLKPSDHELLSEYMRITPEDAVQPTDISRAIIYLSQQNNTAITNVLILQTHKQPVRYLHTYIRPNNDSTDIKYAQHVTQHSTEYGTLYGDRNRRPWALITGASDGIGRDTAIRLASMNYDIVIMARRKDKLDDVANICQSRYSVNTLVYTVDVNQLNELKNICIDAVNKLGTKYFNILVGNAGLNKRRTIINSDPVLLDDVVAVNYTANQYLTTWLAPILVRNRSGSIIYTNSLAVSSLVIGQAGTPSYFSSKFALAGFANSVYEDVREFGVQVSSLFVGLVNNSLGNTPGPLKYSVDTNTGFIQNSDVADAIEYIVDNNQNTKTCAATHLHLHLQQIVFPATKKLTDAVLNRDYTAIQHNGVQSRL